MRELNVSEVQEVNGGIIPVVAVVIADVYLIGFTAGVLTGYATVKSLLK